jgi:hypothetical protein
MNGSAAIAAGPIPVSPARRQRLGRVRYKSFASTGVIGERMQKPARFDTGIEFAR